MKSKHEHVQLVLPGPIEAMFCVSRSLFCASFHHL